MTQNIMSQYVDEQTEALNQLIQSHQFQNIADTLPSISTITIVGTGSSYHMALAGASIFNKLGFKAQCLKPSEVTQHNPDLAIFISQTGTSLNVLNVVDNFNSLKIALTENIKGPISKVVDHTIDINSKGEKCNAKTKGVSLTYASLVLLAYALKKETPTSLTDDINSLDTTINKARQWANNNNWSQSVTSLVVIGDKDSKANGLEAALKMLEVCLIPCLYTDDDEFSHGYHRMINENSAILSLSLSEQPMNTHLSELMESVGGQICTIGPDLSNNIIVNSPLHQLAAVHTLIAEFADQYGYDPNMPLYDEFVQKVKTRID